jgi:hypothetical protein
MRCLALSVALIGLALPASAAEPGKLNAPPPGGWEAALAAVRPDLPSPALAASAAVQSLPSQATRPPTKGNDAPAHEGSALGKQLARTTAVALPDDQISNVRGGFGGLDFSIFFSGHVDTLGQVEGQLLAGSNGVAVPEPVFGISDGQVNIQTYIGDFQGASGIFQIAQVPGNYNVVNQNMFIQINLMEPSNIGLAY